MGQRHSHRRRSVPAPLHEAVYTCRSDAHSLRAGIILLTGAGLCYHYWYKWEVLRKMARAFAKGYDPVLELAQATAKETDGSRKKGIIRRKEQDYIDKVINGEISGECAPSLARIRPLRSLADLSSLTCPDLLLMGPKVGA